MVLSSVIKEFIWWERPKKNCFIFLIILTLIVFLFVMTGASLDLIFLGWILLWPGLLIVYKIGQLSAANIIPVAFIFIFVVVPYLYVLSCIIIFIKRHIEQ